MNSRTTERLVAIADELDECATRSERLFAERVALWRKARDAGATTIELAALSRVSDKTVSKLTRTE